MVRALVALDGLRCWSPGDGDGRGGLPVWLRLRLLAFWGVLFTFSARVASRSVRVSEMKDSGLSVRGRGEYPGTGCRHGGLLPVAAVPGDEASPWTLRINTVALVILLVGFCGGVMDAPQAVRRSVVPGAGEVFEAVVEPAVSLPAPEVVPAGGGPVGAPGGPFRPEVPLPQAVLDAAAGAVPLLDSGVMPSGNGLGGRAGATAGNAMDDAAGREGSRIPGGSSIDRGERGMEAGRRLAVSAVRGDFPAMEYPEAARRRGLSGTVRVGWTVEADGRISGVRLLKSSGTSLLDDASLRHVRSRFRFEAPGLRIPYWYEFVFRL